MKLSVAKLGEAEGCAEVSPESFGAVHILVNNAGISLRGTGTQSVAFLEITREYWDGDDESIETGVLNRSRAGLPRSAARGDGRMVSTISGAGRGGAPPLSAYAMVRGGVVPVSKALAKGGGRYPAGVNCVSQAPTPPAATAAARGPQGREAIQRAYPGGRSLGSLGQPGDVANAVASLRSGVSQFGTGQPLSVGGGFSMVR